jgi:uncharacterized protein YqeY
MSSTEQLTHEIKTAMTARDTKTLTALRDVKSKIMLEATSGTIGEVTEEAETKIIVKLYKQRIDTYDLYIKEGREDLAEDELFEAKVIEKYMPEMMSEDDIRKVVQEKITQMAASGTQSIGKVMGPIMGQLSGKADGGMISKIVKEELNK